MASWLKKNIPLRRAVPLINDSEAFPCGSPHSMGQMMPEVPSRRFHARHKCFKLIDGNLNFLTNAAFLSPFHLLSIRETLNKDTDRLKITKWKKIYHANKTISTI